MKKSVNKNKLNTIINDIKLDIKKCINNIEYIENIMNLMKNSIENNIEKYKNYNIIDSHTIINDFIIIDQVYSLSYTIYNDCEIKRDKNGRIKELNYIPYAGDFNIGKYNDTYFFNRYQLDKNTFMKKNNNYIVRKHKIIEC